MRLHPALVLLLLVAGVAFVYAPVVGHEFVGFDDYLYVRDHPWLRDPLDLAWLRRALMEPYAAYWIPLTMALYRIDAALWGPGPTGILLTNAALHALDTGLLFLVMRRMTGATGRSAFVAAAFALHPQHVESVAWATERKDVLAAFFWIAAMGLHAYAHAGPPDTDARSRSSSASGAVAGRDPGRRGADLGVALCMALGSMAKPSLVTLPLSLVVLDYWPLGRLRAPGGSVGSIDPARLRRALLEKTPLFAIAAGAALLVVGSQRAMGGQRFADHVDAGVRLANAVESVVLYLGQAIAPVGLSPFYSLDPARRIGWMPFAAALGLVGVSALVWRVRSRQPWLLAGWLWLGINLAPVLGLVGVGMQARADRWMYLPSIGLAWMVAWGVAPLVRSRAWPAASVASGCTRGHLPGWGGVLLVAALLSVWIGLARRQVHVWRDTHSLFTHALEVDPTNWYAHHRLAVWHRLRNEPAEAERHYIASLVAMPQQAYTQGELADVLTEQGEIGLADRLYRNVARTGWHDRRAAERLGRIFLAEGRAEPARSLLARAVERRPMDETLRRDLARAASRLERHGDRAR
ncbi:MAG: hypothetical protein R3E53_03925 [Myxococcota bacterium]